MSAFACALCGLLLLTASLPAFAQYLGAPLVPDADPGVDHTQRTAEVPPQFRRTPVYYRTEYPQGTIIVNTADRFLYLIMANNVALRYGIGVGRAGFQ
jgi:lipoprotein-anchoring transpeptidase ErfK/SrfK